MKRFLKIACIVGLCLTLLGGGCFLIGWGATGFKVSALSNVALETLEYTETAETTVHTLKIDYSVADIKVEFGQNDKLNIRYPKRHKKNGKAISEISLTEANGTLTIKEKTPALSLFTIDFSDPTVVITLPQARIFALELTTDNGDIKLSDGGEYDHLNAETDNGDIKIGRSTCTQDMTLETDNGSISVADFKARNLTATTDNGNVTLSGGEASGKIVLETDNGNIKTSGAIKANSAELETDNGNLQVKATLNADTVILSTDNGNIYARLSGKQADYTAAIKIGNGDSNIGNFVGGEKRLQAETENGDIEIVFEN